MTKQLLQESVYLILQLVFYDKGKSVQGFQAGTGEAETMGEHCLFSMASSPCFLYNPGTPAWGCHCQ